MSSFVETTEEEENNKQKKKAELWWTKAKISNTERDTRTHTHNNKKKKDAPCGSEPGLVSSRVLSHKCIPTWKAHQMMWTQRLCVKVMARLPGKQHLYTTLGTVNICTVKAREFNPSSSSSSPFFKSPFFFLVCSRRLSAHENRTIKARGKKKKPKDNTTRRFYPVCVVVVLWQLQSLNLFSALAGRRGALYHRATPRRHLSSGVLSEHAYLFSDNSLYSLNRTKKIVSIFFFLSIKTDELKVKKKHTKRTAASQECNRRACSHTVQTSAVLFLPSHSSHFCTEENESREERKLVLSGGGPQKKKNNKKKCDDEKSSYNGRDGLNCASCWICPSLSAHHAL